MLSTLHAPVGHRSLVDAGRLLDVTRLSHAAQMSTPVYITDDAWRALAGSLDSFATAHGDRIATRALVAARAHATAAHPTDLAKPSMPFTVTTDTGELALLLTVGPDDEGHPVATIGLPTN